MKFGTYVYVGTSFPKLISEILFISKIYRLIYIRFGAEAASFRLNQHWKHFFCQKERLGSIQWSGFAV